MSATGHTYAEDVEEPTAPEPETPAPEPTTPDEDVTTPRAADDGGDTDGSPSPSAGRPG